MGSDILNQHISEHNPLLDQLEAMILEAEANGTFSQDNINEMLRIVHTLRGSSAPLRNQEARKTASPRHQKEGLISVQQSRLNQLSALVGEIVITEAMVTGSPDLKGLGNLDLFYKSARQLRKLTDELQDISMSLRMVPIAATFQKMNRIVRDMSGKLNRPVRLTIVGENTEVDKTIVDNIGDPIMHMIRNSMEHGMEETEEERISAGKNPVGEIILSAQDTGSEIIITIQDDGKGISDEAGFSGRGVGMDAVKRTVEELGGTVTISSRPGQGMTATMKIPLTMSIMDGMEVSVGGSIFTIPIHNIRQSFKVTEHEVLHDTVKGELVNLMGHYYPIVRAKQLYSLPGGADAIEDGILLWLESGDASYCLLVDELMGEHQVVVKPLPAYVNNFDIKKYGIIGCSILGDGSISVILDAGHLSNAAFSR